MTFLTEATHRMFSLLGRHTSRMPTLAHHSSLQPCHCSDCCCFGECAPEQDSTCTATCREFEFILMSEPNLAELAVMQRLQVNAAIAAVQLGHGGKLVVETTDLTAQVFKVRSSALLTLSPLLPLPLPCRRSGQPRTQCTPSRNACPGRLASACCKLLTTSVLSPQYPVCSLLHLKPVLLAPWPLVSSKQSISPRITETVQTLPASLCHCSHSHGVHIYAVSVYIRSQCI